MLQTKNMLQTKMLETGGINLTHWVNQTRQLMAYDRKLKNAVSQSVIELLAREGLSLKWSMRDRQLVGASICSNKIEHFGGIVKEEQHSESYCKMVARLFDGQVSPQSTKTPKPDAKPTTNPSAQKTPHKTKPHEVKRNEDATFKPQSPPKSRSSRRFEGMEKQAKLEKNDRTD